MAKVSSKKNSVLGNGQKKKIYRPRKNYIPGGTGKITINKRDIDVYFGLIL